MTEFKSEFLRTLSARGFIHQMTDEVALDDALCADTPVTAYIGFDCTAPSLHVGSLVQIMMLRHLQKCGHKPIVLMGGGTTRIGDPSGRDESRMLLSDDDIAANMAGIRGIFEQFLTFGEGPTDAIMVDNYDWLQDLGYISFLRDIGPHFTINRMLTFDSVKLRLDREQPLTFLEFNYMIMQAYDFMELGRRYGCALQMGGSDQWGNIVNGIELTRRIDAKSAYGLTTPLIETSDGAKMGKTARGAIWLNEDALPAYDYWQFWRNAADADVGRFLRLFTDLSLDEIADLEAREGAAINEGKIILANEATAMARGPDAARDAAETSRKTFEEGGHGEDLPRISADLTDGAGIVDLLVDANLAESKGAARRLIKQGGARVNGDKVSDPERMVTAGDATTQGVIKLSAGKKRHALIVPA